MLPILSGGPIRVIVRPSLGGHLAASSIPGRQIHLDSSVFSRHGEFERILIHEIFHYGWVRLSNAKRRAWEQVIAREFAAGARGELGWSAEWRKAALRSRDILRRTPRWRRYACESFCDTAAWMYCRLRAHDEFTLTARARATRRKWFAGNFPKGAVLAV